MMLRLSEHRFILVSKSQSQYNSTNCNNRISILLSFHERCSPPEKAISSDRICELVRFQYQQMKPILKEGLGALTASSNAIHALFPDKCDSCRTLQ